MGRGATLRLSHQKHGYGSGWRGEWEGGWASGGVEGVTFLCVRVSEQSQLNALPAFVLESKCYTCEMYAYHVCLQKHVLVHTHHGRQSGDLSDL